MQTKKLITSTGFEFNAGNDRALLTILHTRNFCRVENDGINIRRKKSEVSEYP